MILIKVISNIKNVKIIKKITLRVSNCVKNNFSSLSSYFNIFLVSLPGVPHLFSGHHVVADVPLTAGHQVRLHLVRNRGGLPDPRQRPRILLPADDNSAHNANGAVLAIGLLPRPQLPAPAPLRQMVPHGDGDAGDDVNAVDGVRVDPYQRAPLVRLQIVNGVRVINGFQRDQHGRVPAPDEIEPNLEVDQ